MGEMGVQAVGLPDVSIESKARKNVDLNRWDEDIQYICICNHGCGSLHTPDVRTAMDWAVEHENSDGHLISKWDRLPEEEQDHIRNAGLATRVRMIFDKHTRKTVDRIGGMEKHEH